MKYKFLVLMFTATVSLFSQNKVKKNRFDFSLSYGPQVNFFVRYGFSRQKDSNGNFIPHSTVFGYDFFQKKAVGNHLGFALKYQVSKKGYWGIGFERAENFGVYNIAYRLNNSTLISVESMKLRHLNNYFEIYYMRNIKVENKFFWQFGLYLLDPHQQEITVSPLNSNYIIINERTGFGDANLAEMGLKTGFDYYFYKSDKFDVGITNNYYFTVTTGEFESIN